MSSRPGHGHTQANQPAADALDAPPGAHLGHARSEPRPRPAKGRWHVEFNPRRQARDGTIAGVLAPGVDTLTAIGLIALSFLTSLITATFSLGGGSLMITAMALVLPPVVVVPVHACVQFGSNAGRAWVQRAHIQWHFILWLTAGALIGSVIGGRLAFLLPEKWFAAAIGVFVLATTWLPQPPGLADRRTVQFFGGAFVSAVGMVVGAAGPLLAAFVRGIPDRRQLVATHAMLNSLQHIIKVAVFAAMGFAFRDYVPLILAMVAAGFVGTTVGSRLLTRVPEQVFRFGFRVLLSAVAIGLIWHAFEN